MSVYTAAQLDLSRLPAFQIVAVDEKAELDALVAGITARFNARGVPYDVGTIKSDGAVILAEEFAFRKTLTLQALNDAGLGLTVSFGYGARLDHLAATFYADLGLRRLALVDDPRPFAAYPEDWESDDRFKLRISLAPEARSGSLGAYEYEALTAAPHLYDALALNHASGLVRPGQILVVLLGREPDPNPLTAIPAQEEPAQIALAAAAIRDRSEALASDEVLVRAAVRQRIARGYRLGIRRGPDPALVLALARVQYDAYVRLTKASVGNRMLGKLLAESLEKRQLAVSGVEYVHALPGSGADVDPGVDGVVQVTDLTLVPEVIGG